MINEFKDFIMKGNVMDLAVAVIIAGAFALITASLVGDIIMPIVGWIFGGLDFSNGSFLTTIINFVIIGFVIFMMVKFVKSLEEKKEEAPAAPPAEEVLLGEIRDLLKK